MTQLSRSTKNLLQKGIRPSTNIHIQWYDRIMLLPDTMERHDPNRGSQKLQQHLTYNKSTKPTQRTFTTRQTV